MLESELLAMKSAFTGASRKRKDALNSPTVGRSSWMRSVILPEPASETFTRLAGERISAVGGMKDIHVDVRIIAATNRDLRQAMQRGAFRRISIIG
jgi:transcriptional regulator with GAF, ATPase, and Fis domain